jgi:hypothetical protein
LPVLKMPKRKPPASTPAPTPATPPEPPSETVRLAGDLMEKLREIAFNTRDSRNKRFKLTQLADQLFRPVIEQAYAEYKAKQPKAKE